MSAWIDRRHCPLSYFARCAGRTIGSIVVAFGAMQEASAFTVRARPYFEVSAVTEWNNPCRGPSGWVTQYFDQIAEAYAVYKANWETQNEHYIATQCTYPTIELNIVDGYDSHLGDENGWAQYVNGTLLTYDVLYHTRTYHYGVGPDTDWPQQRSGLPIYGRYECPVDLGEVVVSEVSAPYVTRKTVYCRRTDLARPDVKSCPVGDPLYPSSGVQVAEESDYQGRGAFPLRFVRSYSSLQGNWRHNYNRYVMGDSLRAAGQACLQTVGYRTGQPYCYPYVDGVGTNDVLLVRGLDEPVTFPNGTTIASNPSVPDRLTLLRDGANNVIGWVVLDPSKLVLEVYGSDGRIREMWSAFGQRHLMDYSTASTPLEVASMPGLLVSVTDNFGRQLQLAYNDKGRVISLTDPAGQHYAYSYDEAMLNVTAATYPDGSQRRYHYNEQNLTDNTYLPTMLTGVTDESTRRHASFTYKKVSGRSSYAASTEQAGGVNKYVTTPVFTDNNRSTIIVDPLGSTTTVTYQVINNVLKETSRNQPAGSGCNASTSRQSYDANGNATQRDDFNGRRVCFAYDTARNLETVRVEALSTSATCANYLSSGAALVTGSRKTSTQWHPDWHLKTRQAEPGKLTTWVYNGQPDPFNGNAIANCAPANALLPDGKPIAVLCKQMEQATTDADGSVGFGAILQSGVEARQTSWTYNQYGQVLTANGTRTDVNDTTTYSYYPDTTAEHTKGDVQSVSSPLGRTTLYTQYDKHGQVLQMVDANNVVTDYAYDVRQRLTRSSTNGRSTSYDYYPTGLLKRVTLPDGSFIQNSYDDAHRLIAIEDNFDSRIDYTLDNAGNRITEKVFDPSGVLTQRVARLIDPLGRIQQATVGVSANAGSGSADPFAGSVSLLLHMDGPSGGNAFIDSSGKGKSPSAVASPVVTDEANAKGGSAAGNFTGGYLWYAPSADFDMGAGDFTVEGWFKFNSGSVGSRAILFGHANSSGGDSSFAVSKSTGEVLTMSLVTSAGYFGFTGTVKVLPNVWYHLALVRSGNTLTLYRDGAVDLTGSVTGAVPARTSKFGVGVVGEYTSAYGGSYGARMMGWIDDFRITKGVARYTNPFTPPQAPLPDPSP
jgi:YD repeat-containing protein